MAGLIKTCVRCGKINDTGSRHLCSTCQGAVPAIPDIASPAVTPGSSLGSGLPASKRSDPPTSRTPGRESGRTPTVILDAKSRAGALPDVIGGHKIEGTLGSGGMGVVYLAREPALDRQVALKVLKPIYRNEVGPARLLEEAVVTGRLAHPGIVPIYQVGNDAQHGPWYTMKKVEGRSLAEILNGLRDDNPADVEAYGLPALLAIFKDVCDAAAFAHHHRIVHRDLKPGNVMIGEFGEVMVLDWGLCRVVDESGSRQHLSAAPSAELGVKATDSNFSQAGNLIGTAGYMSPEQARGQGASASPASDVYSLGAILYQMLTLRLPVDGRPEDAIARTVRGQLIPAEKRPLGRNAPRALCQIAMKALAFKAGDRYPDARALARDIEAYLGGRAPWAARSEGWEAATGKWELAPDAARCEETPARLVHAAKLDGDLRLAFRVHGVRARTSWEASVWVALRAPLSTDGYMVRFVTGDAGGVELLRNGVSLGRRNDVALPSAGEFDVRIVRDADRLSVLVNGQRILEHRDLFPLRGERAALSVDAPGARFSSLLLETRGTPLQLEFLALPDKLFSMGQTKQARDLYRALAESHPERSEGLIARYKAAACAIELGLRDDALADLKLLEGTSLAALVSLGKAHIGVKNRSLKETWAALLEGCDSHRNDPVRIELWTMILSTIDRVGRDTPANARTLCLQLLGLPWVAPHEQTQVVGEIMRQAGTPEKKRAEALALLDAYPANVVIRMECHALLSRLGITPEHLGPARAALHRTRDLSRQVTRRDLARILIWLIETYLAEGDIAGAEKWLGTAYSSLSHPSPGGLWTRNWCGLLACAQGKHLDCLKILGRHSEAYGAGTGAHHVVGLILEAAASGVVSGQDSLTRGLASAARALPEWKAPLEALSGQARPETFRDAVAGEPGEVRCELLLAGGMALLVRGDLTGSTLLFSSAGAETEGRAFAAWFTRRLAEDASKATGRFKAPASSEKA